MEKIWSYEWHSSHFIDNKRYTKVNKYEVFLAKKNSTESIEYEERLIDYDEDYESYDSYLDWDGPKIFY